MMKFRTILLIILMFFSFGCAQTLKTSVSHDQKLTLAQNTSSLSDPTEINDTDSEFVEDVSDVNPDPTETNNTDSDFTENETIDPDLTDDTDTPAEEALSESSEFPETNEDDVVSEKDDEAGSDESSESSDNEPDEDDEALSREGLEAHLDEARNFCDLAQDLWQNGKIEKALEALDQAYAMILEIESDGNPDMLQQKEELRFMISKRILEIHASRNVTTKGNHNAIPITMNHHVKKEIESLSRCKKEDGFFISAYKRSGRYRSYIVSELKKAGLPEELSWLPLIESGFKVNALSPARALGIWQFIPSTGYKFGLKRDKYIDERMDYEKSTKAAIAYLKELHEIFGDWTTVLAAYNCGEGKVLHVIRTQNINYLDNFWDLYEKLPRETARYVPRFLATLHMVNNPTKYNLDSITPYEALEYETIKIPKQAHLKDIAKIMGLSPSVLKELNPELRYNLLPENGYILRVPSEKTDILIAKINEIPKSSLPAERSVSSARQRQSVVYYKIKRGDTLSSIARRYKTSIKSIARANRISKKSRIVAGKVLKIPYRGASSYVASAKNSGRSSHRISTHIVKSGDSLWNIARRYGTTTKELHRLNRLSGSRLQIGQVLKVPVQGRRISSKSDDLKTYRVKSGDVPFEIAKRHNMSLERLLKVNRLNSWSTIYPGQKLYVE